MSILYGENENISSDKLKDFYSEGLEADYNAIYRTPKEYLDAFENLNCDKIFSEDIFKDLSNHIETKYVFFN